MDGPSRAAAALPSGPAAATTTAAHVPPLAHPALDALDVVDKYRKPLAEWWHAHEEWRRAFPPASLDDLVRPQTAPTLGHEKLHEKISNPTPEQRLAYAEADKARKQAHALWKEHNAPRKKGVRKAYDDQRERVRPADDGARATEHRAKMPALLEKHAERERARYDAKLPAPTDEQVESAEQLLAPPLVLVEGLDDDYDSGVRVTAIEGAPRPFEGVRLPGVRKTWSRRRSTDARRASGRRRQRRRSRR